MKLITTSLFTKANATEQIHAYNKGLKLPALGKKLRITLPAGHDAGREVEVYRLETEGPATWRFNWYGNIDEPARQD